MPADRLKRWACSITCSRATTALPATTACRQTAASSYKPAVLENGVRVMVPPFITTGERIVVDTNEVTYLRRAD